jgi:hypothetical protein
MPVRIMSVKGYMDSERIMTAKYSMDNKRHDGDVLWIYIISQQKSGMGTGILGTQA